MYKLVDEAKKEIDANFSIEKTVDGFDLIVESRGGSTGGYPARNPDYEKAMYEHLKRMSALGVILSDIQVVSKKTKDLSDDERRICPEKYSLPLALNKVPNLADLRLAIGRASAAHRRQSGSGGNSTKKLKLSMSWQGAHDLSAGSIANLLIQAFPREEPTDDLEELTRRVDRALTWIGNQSVPPIGQNSPEIKYANTKRYVRDPEVVAWVLNQAAGKCENCGEPAPFIRANGLPYLEAHHVIPLAEGGPDTVDNVVACCPNCHRRLHHDPDKKSLSKSLVTSIQRLRNFS